MVDTLRPRARHHVIRKDLRNVPGEKQNGVTKQERVYRVIRERLPERDERRGFCEERLSRETFEALRKFHKKPAGSPEMRWLNRLIIDNQPEIDHILEGFGVPLLDEQGHLKTP